MLTIQPASLWEINMAAKHIHISKRDEQKSLNKRNALPILDKRLENKIKSEVYDVFRLVDGNEIKVLDILQCLNLNIFKQDYRKIKYSYDALLQAILLMKIKQLKFFTQLVSYLEDYKIEARKLGLTKIPDRRTFSHFINNILDDKTRAIIDFTAKKIVEVADKFSIDLDIEINIEKPTKEISKGTIYRKRDKKTKELAKLIKKKISPFLDIKQNGNCIYTKNNFIDLLIYMALTQDFAENGSTTMKELRKYVPNADTLLYHLEKYGDIAELQRMFNVIFEKLWDMARKENLFNKYRKFDVAIDFTDWLFYGDKNTPMVVGRKPERGTNRGYRFATINIVEAGRRFTLLALPVGPFDKKEDILSKLLAYAKQRIKIRKVYADRGFFSGKCIRVFNKNQLNFLMPCTAYSTIIHLLKITSAPCVIKDFMIANVPINVIIVENDGRKYSFASNEDWNENDVDLADKVFRQYGKRWGIETSYRVKKYSFRSKTTSKNYFVRFFYFMFSVLMYNLWILIDIMICLMLYGEKYSEHVITSKLFATIFYKTGEG